MDGIIVNILNTETFTGEDGLQYVRITKELLYPRKTYVKGEISGKYRGDKLFLDSPRPNLSLYDFEIYEASVVCDSKENFRKDKPFKVKEKIEFPREKLPKDIPVTIKTNGNTYDVNILEPSLYDFESIRKYRQIHGDEVYGHFTGYITGYVFDYERKEEIEIREYFDEEEEAVEIYEPANPLDGVVVSVGEKEGAYTQRTTYKSGKPYTYWTFNTQRNIYPAHYGCVSGTLGFIGIILGIFFLIVAIPNFFYFLLIGGLFLVLYYLAPILKWIFRILGAAILLLFFIGVLGSLGNSRKSSTRTSAPIQDEREVISQVDPAPRTSETSPDFFGRKAQIIKRFRSWKDYDGKLYEGYYTLKISDLEASNRHKNQIPAGSASANEYDRIISLLKEKDKNALGGLYRMLDSIGEANNLSKTKFAEMAVTMVQDIPYSLVLDQDCKADIYADPFISQWLSKPDGWCDPYQRFGINTPVEFMANLKGDCDTRTLLLYTVLAHYGYDVALLSSEFYRHSVIGINLPFEGTAFIHDGKRYIVWETTANQIRPGILDPKMANMNYWRISLKSKTE